MKEGFPDITFKYYKEGLQLSLSPLSLQSSSLPLFFPSPSFSPSLPVLHPTQAMSECQLGSKTYIVSDLSISCVLDIVDERSRDFLQLVSYSIDSQLNNKCSNMCLKLLLNQIVRGKDYCIYDYKNIFSSFLLTYEISLCSNIRFASLYASSE